MPQDRKTDRSRLRTFLKRYSDASKEAKKPVKFDYAELVDTVVVPDIDAELEELSAIGAPKADVKEVNQMLEAVERSLEKAESDPEAVVDNRKKIFGEASQEARELGLEACGNR